jgi:plasmid stabilization system protein ParE
MNEHELFSSPTCDEQTNLAERELSAFMAAVAERFGPEQARASAQDWLDEAERMVDSPRSTTLDWRSVTIAASVRLASRIDAAQYRQQSRTTLGDTKVSPIPSSNCISSVLLF